MAEQIVTGSIAAPGFSGLNTQDSSIQLSSGFALEANNCVIDRYGRIGARKGWTPVNATSFGSGHIKTIFEFTKADNNLVFAAANNKIYGQNQSTGLYQEYTVDGITISDDNWQAINMPYGTGPTASAHAIWVQSGHQPLMMHKTGASHAHTGSYAFEKLGSASTLPTGYTASTFKPSCGIYAYGRLWVANTAPEDTQTVYFSDLQNPTNWTTGTSGKLDISAVIPTGDPIVALAQHNGFLIIFCKKHIVIYSGAKDPSTIKLEDTITGVGCIARDSVQSVAGTDIYFLSSTGVQSLQRLIQEKSLPFRDISKNVRDELITLVNSETVENIKAVYYATDAFYLLSLPSSGFTYCFDTRAQLENGAARTTIWKQITPTAFCITENKDLYVGQIGYIGKYDLYEDNGATYRMSYFTNYFDFGSATTNKILKRINVTAIGGSAQPIAIKWGYDYTRNYFSRGITLQRVEVYEYGVGEYNIATFTNGIALDIARIPASGSGTVLQLGFESDINGTPLSIQKIDFFLKQGKTL